MGDQLKAYDVLIIGGGASGMTAAISAARAGSKVMLCERLSKLGKKVLASGNGRCNLLNNDLESSFYNEASRPWVEAIFKQAGKDEILSFFRKLGLLVYSDRGRFFPASNQALSVMEVLEEEIQRLTIDIAFDSSIVRMSKDGQRFSVTASSGKRFCASRVILCAGGKSYPKFGTDGLAYGLAQSLGHELIGPVPICVPLLSHDSLCKNLQGIRIQSVLTSVIDGKIINETAGEILFTDYGLSGSAILDISEEIAIALERGSSRDVKITADLFPFMTEKELHEELSDRLSKKCEWNKILIGLLPGRFSPALEKILRTKNCGLIVQTIKEQAFSIVGTKGWEEAEFTAGGIDLSDVRQESLESQLCPGLFFAGEVLNVHGRRGGYNLAWAWASGLTAGMAASK